MLDLCRGKIFVEKEINVISRESCRLKGNMIFSYIEKLVHTEETQVILERNPN